jgi:hypothetical protein
MSTKTTFKRIALVAVATLSFGSLSVVSASASSETAAGVISAINLKAATANTNVIDSNIDIYFGASKTATVITAGHFSTFAAAVTAYPAGGYVGVTGVNNSGTLTFTSTLDADTSTGATVKITHETSNSSAAAETLKATGTDGLGMFRFAPTKAGVYTVTVWNDVADAGAIDLLETRQTIDITVVAASGYSGALSTMNSVSGAGGIAGTSTTNLVALSAVKTLATATRASITISLFDAKGAAMTTGNTLTASIAGAGGFSTALAITADTPGAANCDVATNPRVKTGTADAVNTLSICSDGTAGVGTVTITVTNAAGVSAVLGTKTIIFYGSVVKLVATANYTILKAAGGATGAQEAGTGKYNALSTRALKTDIPAVIVKATDSSGNPVGGLTILGLSSDVTNVNSFTAQNPAAGVAGCAEDDVTADFSSGGVGFYNCALTSTGFATSGKTATMTFRILDPSDVLGVAYLTSVVNLTIGGSVATETLSLDKTSYEAGEGMVITRTAKDSAGNPVADGTASPAVTFNKAVGGTSPAAGAYVGGVSATSATAPSVFAPVSTGAFLARMTSGNAAASVVTATATIAGDTATSDIAQAAADAAAEATDAANAATDAANAAAEAADAATAAAQDAADAVAALSTQVAELIGDLRKQITSLTNLVIKIQKKVKA